MSEVGKLDFGKFKHPVAAQFARMAQHELFCVDVDKDELWDTYLDSFPDGVNNMYRQRREYDCSCCRSFIKRVGNVVAIIDGKITTIWDAPTGEPAFDQVSQALGALVRQHPIANKFLTREKTAGVDKNFEQLMNEFKTWTHFFVNIPAALVKRGTEIGPILSGTQASHDVLLRSLTELTDDSVATTRELISQGSLYRGEEYAGILRDFAALKQVFNGLPENQRDLYVWNVLHTTGGAVARIRNTSIGTLLIDLSLGMIDLEDAVRKYEAVVAPTNYKRPTALVTQRMVDEAKAKVESLGLTSALQRRYANIDDITASNLLFVDRENTVLQTTDDAFGGIATGKGSKQFDKVETIGVNDFILKVLPTARTLEVMFEGPQTGNLCSLVTSADPSAAQLFKWGNPFSWSYNGDLADSIRERVKQAGGNVEGDLCCRLAWYNHDDLDFHMAEQPGHYEIAFPNKGRLSPNGGTLDVDMNAGSGTTRTPVENIFYKDRRKMRNGKYLLFVHQYARRDTKDVGFDVEIDILGNITKFSYPNPLATGKAVQVGELTVQDGEITLKPLLQGVAATREVWGIKTNNFHRVRALCLSPNFWDNAIGNMHYFFMLDGCKSDTPARGFYNEFLKADLDPHRKVLEIVGSKMRTNDTDNQLSGLGFSSTKRASVLARVAGAFNRVLRVEI